MADWEFANRELLWLLLILVPLLVWYLMFHLRLPAHVAFSSGESFKGKFVGSKAYFFHLLTFFRMAAIGLIIVALARPQSSTSFQDITTEGIDIVMAVDISSSMLARRL